MRGKSIEDNSRFLSVEFPLSEMGKALGRKKGISLWDI